MNLFRSAIAAFAVALTLAPLPQAVAAGFVDPLDRPAQVSPLASKSLMQGVTRAGARLVAVGQRGHILVSDDSGATWSQAKVPVSSDLTAVFFVNDKMGWAVGHDGVILNSVDGGLTWALQLDGRKANELLVKHMQGVADADPQSAEKKQLLGDAKRFQEQGADKPFLDIWFSDENNGYVVGAYNLIFATHDGGKSWESLFDQTDNPKQFNLYGIAPADGTLYIAGEGGLVLRHDPASKRFRASPTPYNGSYFGVIGDKASALIFGLRGNVYRTDDGGKTWVKVDVGLPAAIVSATKGPDGTIMLADIGGRISVSADGGRSFKPTKLTTTTPIAGIAEAGKGRLARVGPRGVSIAEFAPN